ncbi:unnamed protein product [Linum tenue]|uniref:Vacuolar ATPase assembly integral membrane protein VMA21 homolog n=1 Tax=Linum tenue TaxID=586396 RepID=A0AAV0IX90_9ROSI|nr:unnamed protein product [Linum tenue]CAI0401365.1 unnamed protein product [Linum tenue]
MAGAANKFFVTSMFIWMAPIAVLFAFNHDLLPGLSQLSPHTLTLLSGLVAVVSVNIVMGFYIYIAVKDKHEPTSAAEAKASLTKLNKGKTASRASKKD